MIALVLLLLISIALCSCENFRAEITAEEIISAEQVEMQRKLIDVWNPSQAVDLFPFSSSGGVRFSALTGRWYQTQGSIFLINNQFCNIVDYDAKGLSVNDEFNNRDLPIRVTVSTRIGSPVGNLQQSMGSATNQAYGIQEIPGILYGIYQSGLQQDTDSLNPGVFVIQATGPVNIRSRQYEYMVVTDPAKSFSLVLAQDVANYKANFEADVLLYMVANGFDKLWNRPYDVVHEGCLYPQQL